MCTQKTPFRDQRQMAVWGTLDGGVGIRPIWHANSSKSWKSRRNRCPRKCAAAWVRAGGRVGVRALNDNTGGIQIPLVTLVPSVWHFIPLCLTVNADVRESYHKTKNPGNTCSSFIDLNGIWWKKNTHFKSNEAKYQKSTCPYQNKCSVVSKYNCCND